MDPVSVITGTACPLDRNDVDTDAIMPKQFLKRVERTGYGPFAFFEDRYLADGETPNPDFVMNKPEHQGANILLTGRNFGCGSSREHAPWGLEDAGFEAIIAPSFADIFRGNCGNIGIVCAQVEEADVRTLFDLVAADPSTEITVDLEQQTISAGDFSTTFPIDASTKRNLLNGLDLIGLTLEHDEQIAEYEQRRASWRPAVTAS